MAQWTGYAVSINCATGTYQGVIKDAATNVIHLSNAFHDGIPCNSVTILASDILDLKLIEKQNLSPAGKSTVKTAKPVPKRAGRTQSLSENVNPNRSTQNGNGNSHKTKPIDIQNNDSLYRQCGNFDQQRNSTPNKRDSKNKQKWNKGWKDEACFGSPLDHSYNKDFDFEKNLALFDKQAIWGELNSQRPDVVRHADQHGKVQTKYRHDENVIAGSMPTTYRQIIVPKQDFCEYMTDDGLIIPSISWVLRNKLWTVADRIGLSWERRIELMGRAATEMAVQLLGGAHRLNPRNSHQWPTVVFLCGPNRQGAIGINTARQLGSHGVNTVVYSVPSEASFIKQELSLYQLTKNKLVKSVLSLPSTADLIIVALCDDSDNLIMHDHLSDWVSNNKASVLAIDPPAIGTPGIPSKYSLVPVLPLQHCADNGKIYLCNLGFPIEIFNEVSIDYKSPFGSKFVIPLYPREA